MRPLFMSILMLTAGCLAISPSLTLAANKISPQKIDGAVTIDAQQAKELFDKGVVFVDVRKEKSFAAGRIPDAFHINLTDRFNKRTLESVINKDQAFVIYCDGHNCLRSAHATKKAIDWGYQNIYYFRDGLPSWRSSGYPIE